MQNLFNGSYFDRLLKGIYNEIQERYGIKKSDIKILRSISHGMNYSLLQDLIEIGIYDEQELTDCIDRLHKHGIVEIVKKDDTHDVVFKLTRAGTELWDQLKRAYDHANEVLYRGMTEEQIKTYKRLSKMVIGNIEEEVKKGE